MKRNSFAWIVLGGCAVALGTFELAACSSDSATGTPTTQTDATAKKDGTSGGDGSTSTGDDGSTSTGDDGSTSSGDAGADCGKPPSLHPRGDSDAGGKIMNFLCPFSAPTGMPWDYCDSGTHCCVPYSGQSTCEATCGTQADGGPFDGRDIACLDAVDCTAAGSAGPVCCGIGLVQQDPVCGTFFGKSFKGTKCATACNDNNNEFAICQSDAQCPSGQTCQAMSATGAQFGTCR